jgi:hypothetical protein
LVEDIKRIPGDLTEFMNSVLKRPTCMLAFVYRKIPSMGKGSSPSALLYVDLNKSFFLSAK